jgi:hypothetical protein
MGNYCDHLEKAAAAQTNNVKADEFKVKFEKLQSLKLEKNDLELLKASCSKTDGMVTLYSLPGNNMVVPSLHVKTHDNPLPFLHLRNRVCPLIVCKEKRSKLHTLQKKEGPLCLHTLLANCLQTEDLGLQAVSSNNKSKPVPKIDRDLTAKAGFKIK